MSSPMRHGIQRRRRALLAASSASLVLTAQFAVAQSPDNPFAQTSTEDQVKLAQAAEPYNLEPPEPRDLDLEDPELEPDAADPPYNLDQPGPETSDIGEDEADPAETLIESRAAAFATNPQLQAQRASQRGVEENLSSARAGRRPTLSGNAQLAFFDQTNSFSTNPGSQINGRTTSFGANFQQPLFRGFQNRNAILRARRDIEAGEALLAATEQNILLAAITAYADVKQGERILDLTLRNRATLKRQAQSTRLRFQVGSSTRTDLAQTESAVANADTQVAIARSDLEAARSSFLTIVGHYPTRLAEMPPLPELPNSLEDLLLTALDQNPAIVEARFREEAALFAVREAQGALSPSLNITSSINRNTGPVNFGLFTDSRVTVSVNAGLNLQVPIYQSGQEFSSIRRAKALRSQRRFETANSARQVEERVRTVFQTLLADRAAIISNREAVRAAEVAARGTQREAASGLTNVLDVLQTQQTLFNAQITDVRAQRTLQVDTYRLMLEAGELRAANLNIEGYADILDGTDLDERAGWRDYFVGFAEKDPKNKTKLGIGLGVDDKPFPDPADAPDPISLEGMDAVME